MSIEGTKDPKPLQLGEDGMIGKERWEEIRRLGERGDSVRDRW